MIRVAGVQLQKHGKIYNFEVNNLEVHAGDYVIADTSRGYDLGEVAVGTREVDESAIPAPVKKLIRIATPQDIQHSTENRQKEREAYTICQKKIEEHQLDMKLVSVEYSFDNSKILFYFTANGRVDFRSLVKDLASVFKMRIELRQIGVRDEAKMLGGLGPCGRPICCGAFLDEFQPVSIKMAKEQNLSLNPTKISGVCGRLMCCLKYEQSHYEQTRKKMPRVGREVSTPDGIGTVSDLNIVKETVMVRITNGDSSEIKEYSLESISRVETSGKSAKADENTYNLSENAAADDGDIQERESEEEKEEKEETGDNGKTKNNEKPNRLKNGRTVQDFRTIRNGHQLGKPVRRENPNKSRGEVADNAQNASQSMPKPVEKPVPSQQQNGSWAEALQKAMDAIN